MPPGEPGGPDSEIFFEHSDIQHDTAFGPECHPNCDCGRYVEIGISVFMQYQKQPDGSLNKLAQQNVDFGGGLERIVAATENQQDVFTIDIFAEMIAVIEAGSGRKYGSDVESTRWMRIISDHARASTMLMADGAMPSNKAQRATSCVGLSGAPFDSGKLMNLQDGFLSTLGAKVLDLYADAYPIPDQRRTDVLNALQGEDKKFNAMIGKGMKEIEKIPSLPDKMHFGSSKPDGFPW